MIVKSEGWPQVRPDDNGIRPAGKPDECFYCRQKVGQPHGKDCVCVDKVVRYDVFIKGEKLGTFERHEPHAWTPQECEFHKNRSSWCKDNSVDYIKWSDDRGQQLVDKHLENADGEGSSCTCSLLTFKFVEVTDEGPLIELREPANEGGTEEAQALPEA